MRRRSQTAWCRNLFVAAAIVGFGVTLGIVPRPARAVPACIGDCNGNGVVTVDEILTMVNIALDPVNNPITLCENGDADGSGTITVDEILTAVNLSLTMCPSVGPPVCGDGNVQPPEECDLGGTCIGGPSAGMHCTAESQCTGNTGVCRTGAKAFSQCASDNDCPGSKCQKCVPFGGKGCAANCTNETPVDGIPYNLVPGVVQGQGIKTGTSGAVVNAEAFTIPLPLNGTQTLKIGKPTASDPANPGNTYIPGVIPAASIQLPKIAVQTIACVCIRGAEYKTCGGTIFDMGGTQSVSCTPNFATAPADCAALGKNPCTNVFGEGNGGSGQIGCQGLSPIDVTVSQDCNGTPGGMPLPPQLALTSSGGPGSAIVVSTLGLGVFVGRCTAAPATFCTDAEPASSRGNPLPLVSTTGMASSVVHNANDFDGFDIGPFASQGHTFSCASLTASPPSLTGADLAAAFTACDQDTVRDIAVTSEFVGQ